MFMCDLGDGPERKGYGLKNDVCVSSSQGVNGRVRGEEVNQII